MVQFPYKSSIMPFLLDPKYIVEAERELGLFLPPLYQLKMIQFNGGEIITTEHSWSIFPIFDGADEQRISRTCNHVVSETNIARTWPGFPALAVAIAENGWGDYLVLLPSEVDMSELRENVFLWVYESGQLLEVADSVEELL